MTINQSPGKLSVLIDEMIEKLLVLIAGTGVVALLTFAGGGLENIYAARITAGITVVSWTFLLYRAHQQSVELKRRLEKAVVYNSWDFVRVLSFKNNQQKRFLGEKCVVRKYDPISKIVTVMSAPTGDECDFKIGQIEIERRSEMGKKLSTMQQGKLHR